MSFLREGKRHPDALFTRSCSWSIIPVGHSLLSTSLQAGFFVNSSLLIWVSNTSTDDFLRATDPLQHLPVSRFPITRLCEIHQPCAFCSKQPYCNKTQRFTRAPRLTESRWLLKWTLTCRSPSWHVKLWFAKAFVLESQNFVITVSMTEKKVNFPTISNWEAHITYAGVSGVTACAYTAVSPRFTGRAAVHILGSRKHVLRALPTMRAGRILQTNTSRWAQIICLIFLITSFKK